MNISRSFAVIWVSIALSITSVMHAQVEVLRTFQWSVSENQPNIKYGGRANTIAVHPTNPLQMHVASESGGLFRSEDGGDRWTHVDSLPVIFTQSVVYASSTVLYVTAKADFRRINGGGLWRSRNGGGSWEPVPLSVPGNHRLSAYEIAIQPETGTIFVATSNGLYCSRDGGSSWEPPTVFGNAGRSVFSVMATDTRVYVGGPAGVYVENTLSQGSSITNVGAIRDMHAIGRSPLARQAFLVNADGRLWESHDNGVGWSPIPGTPTGGAICKGIPFIKSELRIDDHTDLFLDLFFSTGCGLHTRAAPISQLAADLVGSWTINDVDHEEPRDLLLIGNVPTLLASNGGLHETVGDRITWRLVGGGIGGYNALQIHDVEGQLIESPRRFDLYFGTHDNNAWAMQGGSPNIFRYPILGQHIDAHHLEIDRRIPSAADTTLTFASCVFSCGSRLSNALLDDVGLWPDVPGRRGTPVLVRGCQRVQGFRTRFEAGIAVTERCGDDRQTFALFPEEPRDVPRLGRSGFDDPLQMTILYQAYKPNDVDPALAFAGGKLLRADRQLFSEEAVEATYPLMFEFGALGIGPTMNPVFAVDPGNVDHVIAPDVNGSGQVKETRDGGGLWTIVGDLTNLVTADGDLQFASALDRPELGRVFSLVTAISFSPQDPRVVMAGTSEGGIFFSGNNGRNWHPVPGTERIRNVTAFAWQNANRVYVSTFGRGLWRLDNRTIDVFGFNTLCGTCRVVARDGKPDPSFDHSAMVFEGTVLGVRTEDKKVREILVTLGSSVLFTGDPKDAPDDIAITEGDDRDASAYEPLPKGPDGWVAGGIVWTKNDDYVGAVFGESVATLVPPPSKSNYAGSTKSPTRGKPYIRLDSDDFNGVATVAPGGTVELSGTDFVAGVAYEVLINGELVKVQATADGNGSFQTQLPAPAEPGYYRVDVRSPGTSAILDASVFSVRYGR